VLCELEPKSLLPSEPVLVGREREISQLKRYLDLTMNGEGRLALINGEAGIGKTRLVNEFLTYAKKRGIQVLSGWCLSEAAIPYFPFMEAFNTYVSDLDDEKSKSSVTKQLGITGWLKGPQLRTKELGFRELVSTSQITKDRTFDAVADTFLLLTSKEPLILFIDDLQWADQLSLAMLHYLSKKCRNTKLLILGTYRSEDIVPVDGKPHPLEDTLFNLSREGLMTKIELDRLTQNELPTLLDSIFNTNFGKQFVDRLYSETDGNPLFALETLNLLAEEGYISEHSGSWQLTSPAETIGIPSKVHDVILRRISRLDREERELLDIAAVCGQTFDANDLSRILSLDLIVVLKKLVEIETRHKIIRSSDSQFVFTHQKVREVIYKNLQVALRRAYHLKTASCLEDVLSEKIIDGKIADIAHHYVEGGAAEKAFEYLVLLGEKAVDIFANEEAIKHLDKALEATQTNPSLATTEILIKIYRLRGIAWRRIEERPYEKAVHDFNLMLKNATLICDDLMIAEAHYWFSTAYNPYFVDDKESEERIQHITTALEIARKIDNKQLEARAIYQIGGSLFTQSNTRDESIKLFENVIRIGIETDDIRIQARSLRMIGIYHNHRDEYRKAKEYLERAITLFNESGSLPPVDPLFYLTIALTGLGEYSKAISTGHKCLHYCQEYGFRNEVWILNTLGWIYYQLSNIELAKKYNNESLEYAQSKNIQLADGGVPFALSNLGMDYLYENNLEEAEKYIEEAWRVRHQHPGEGMRLVTRLYLYLGKIALAKNNYNLALNNAEESLALSKKNSFKKYISKGLKLKAETYGKMGKLTEAIELMNKALNITNQIKTPHLLWQINYRTGILHEKNGDSNTANEYYSEAINLIEFTASKLHDESVMKTLLNASLTKTIRDAYARTNPLNNP